VSNQLDPHDIAIAGLDALQVTQYARAQEFTLPGDEELTAPPGRFGPLAEELAQIDSRLAVGPPGDRRVSLDTVAGLAWAAAAIAGDQIGALTARIAELERQLAELT
jgi:hypothetical protein